MLFRPMKHRGSGTGGGGGGGMERRLTGVKEIVGGGAAAAAVAAAAAGRWGQRAGRCVCWKRAWLPAPSKGGE